MNEIFEPNFLKELLIDKNIKKLLIDFINIDNVNLLLYGDSGTCKTTIIKCIINNYFNKVIDINKADNILIINNVKDQSIHNFRNLIKSFCKSIHQDKKKFIIIDDLDLICISNQQIIKHCLDKYSKNIGFLMSCTNIQKIIDNLQSRTNIIKTSKISNDTLLKYLLNIKENFNIKLNENMIDMLIETSDNSIKLLNNNLKKIMLLNKININKVKNICYNINKQNFDNYTNYLFERKINQANNVLLELYNNGFSVNDIFENYFHYIKNTNIINEDLKLGMLQYICKYINIFYNIHEESFELILFTNNIYNYFYKTSFQKTSFQKSN
jgi:DNA polymerase III delta prime subunit